MSHETRVQNIGVKEPQVPQNSLSNPSGKMGNRVVEWVKEHPVATVLIVSLIAAAIFVAAPYLAAAALGLAFGSAVVLPSLALVGALGGIGALVGGVSSGIIVAASRSGEKKVRTQPVQSSVQDRVAEIKERRQKILEDLGQLKERAVFKEMVGGVLYVGTAAMDQIQDSSQEKKLSDLAIESVIVAEELINKVNTVKEDKEELLQIIVELCSRQPLSRFWTEAFPQIARKL